MVPIIVLTYLLRYTREDFMQNHQEPINTANMIRAAMKIQQFWKCQKIAHINNTNAIKIQRCYRRHLHTAPPHDNIVGVNLKPSIFTDHWQRHEISSAIAIQAHIRSWYARRDVLAMKQAIVKIQAFSRSWMCRRMAVAIMNAEKQNETVKPLRDTTESMQMHTSLDNQIVERALGEIRSMVSGVHDSLILALNDILQAVDTNKGDVEPLKVLNEHEDENRREEVEEQNKTIRFFGTKRVVNGGKQRK